MKPSGLIDKPYGVFQYQLKRCTEYYAAVAKLVSYQDPDDVDDIDDEAVDGGDHQVEIVIPEFKGEAVVSAVEV